MDGDKEKAKREEITRMTYTESSVCQIGELTCFGCCGRDYKSKDEVIAGIVKNTAEFKKYISEGKSIKEFIVREKDIRQCGICYDVVMIKNKVFCPGHPLLNDGADLREGHCNIGYLCKTAYWFNKWDSSRKNAFVQFIKSKNLSWYDYSIGMDNNSFINEFEMIHNDKSDNF